MSSSPEWDVKERRIALASFVAVTALIAIFLLRDASAFVTSAFRELIGHMGASAGFTVAATGSWLALRRTRPSLSTVLLLGSAITIVGELSQALVPSRAVQLRDIASGLAGVLIAGLLIEAVLGWGSLRRALRVHAVAAGIASLALLVMLAFDLAPRTLSEAAPDGVSCPLTDLAGRIEIGATPSIDEGCFTTSAGGFGLFGPDGRNVLDEDSVFVSSALGDLEASINQDPRLRVRTEFTTIDTFDPDDRSAAGTILLLRYSTGREVLQLRTRDERLDVLGPNGGDALRSIVFSATLKADTTHLAEVQLTASELVVWLDGRQIASVEIHDGWVGQPAYNGQDPGDLTLYIGNHSARTLPFNGVIEWIKINSMPTG